MILINIIIYLKITLETSVICTGKQPVKLYYRLVHKNPVSNRKAITPMSEVHTQVATKTLLRF